MGLGGGTVPNLGGLARPYKQANLETQKSKVRGRGVSLGVERRPKAWLALQELWSQEHPGISAPSREEI